MTDYDSGMKQGCLRDGYVVGIEQVIGTLEPVSHWFAENSCFPKSGKIRQYRLTPNKITREAEYFQRVCVGSAQRIVTLILVLIRC